MALPTITIFGTDIITFSLDLIAFFALYVIISVTLNLEMGYAGIPDFGKVLFFAGGASLAGSFAGRFAQLLLNLNSKGDFVINNPQVASSIDIALANNVTMSITILFVSVLVAMGIGALMGYVASFPAIRLREDFLGMSLFAMGIFFWVFLDNYTPLLGGPNGIRVPDVYAWTGGNEYLVATAIIALFAILVYFYSEKLLRSPFGRLLKAMRENEPSAIALGKDLVRMRITVMVTSSAITGVAGCLYVFYAGVVLPDSIANQIPWTVYPWLIVIMGGTGNNLGVAIGAFVYVAVTKVLNTIKFVFSGLLPFDVNWLYYLVFAVLIISILSTRGKGILGEKPTPTMSRQELQQLGKPEHQKDDDEQEKSNT